MCAVIAGSFAPQGLGIFGRTCAAPIRTEPKSPHWEWSDDWANLTANQDVIFSHPTGITGVADAVLYDHSDLADQLGERRSASAAELIVAAYRRWGEECPTHLYGDFAFAIWDARRRRLFCARDPFGIRPFYYRTYPGRIEFASSAGQLLQGGAEEHLRDSAIADFLVGRILDAQGTFYDGVERLPAAHSLSFGDGQLSLRRYWHLEPKELPPRTHYPEMFEHLFSRSVKARMHGANAPGALLSGGLDSSSIACVARNHLSSMGREPLPTFSALFDAPAKCNERQFVDAVLEQGGFSPTFVWRDGYAPLEGMDRLLRDLDGPVLAPNLTCMRPVLQKVREAGVDILLDGHGGDEVVSHGYGILDDLAQAGRWLKLWRETRAAADTYGSAPWSMLLRVAGKQNRLDARALTRVIRLLAGGSAPEGSRRPLLSRDLVERSSIRERLRAQESGAGSGERQQHLANLSGSLQAYAFEVLCGWYRSSNLEVRYPFWDKHLVEFCVSVPPSEKLEGGWSRLILRRAMKDTLPQAVAQRRTKVDFTHHLSCGLTRHHNEEIMDLLTDRQGSLASYVDLERARHTYEEIAQAPENAVGSDVQAVWKVITLGMWLRLRRTEGRGRPKLSMEEAA